MPMLMFAFLAATLGQPDARSWTKVFEDASKSTYVSRPIGSLDRPERIFWLRHVFPKARAKNVESSQDQWQVNCSAGTYMMLAVVQYDPRGKVLSAQAVPLGAQIPARVERGSRMDKVFRTVCSQKDGGY